MLHELIQEFLKLKQDNTFVTNLVSTLTIVTVLCCSLQYVHSRPNRLGKQEKIAQFSQTVSAGMVIKICQYFCR